nr:MoxR family ATPase [Euzebya rosea]
MTTVPADNDTHDDTDVELLTPSRSAELLASVRAEIGRVIVGQQRVVERVMVGLLAEGHCLLEGAPGLGKTRLLTTLSTAMGGSFSRVQFTPDLLPSDIVGTRIWRQEEGRFTVELGPVFANFVLADEINRAPAKVQSALLEVMAEKQVTIGGESFRVDRPFLVLATQNPIESEGVYQLPEAQRDRFLMKVPVDYPAGPHEEMEIVRRAAGDAIHPREVITLDDVKALQATTRAIHVDPRVADYAVRLVLATREPARQGLDSLTPLIAFGASPRASIGLVEGARALALLRGRGAVEPQDIYDIAYDVLNHRLVLSFDAVADGITVDEVLYHLLTTIPAPQLASSNGAARPPAGPPRIPDATPVPPTANRGLHAQQPYHVAQSTPGTFQGQQDAARGANRGPVMPPPDGEWGPAETTDRAPGHVDAMGDGEDPFAGLGEEDGRDHGADDDTPPQGVPLTAPEDTTPPVDPDDDPGRPASDGDASDADGPDDASGDPLAPPA